MQPKVPAQENKASKSLVIKTCGVVVVGETPSLTGKFVEETHGVLECTQNHSPQESAPEGHNLLVGSREVTKRG